MRELERDIAKIAIVALGIAALYDILAINGGKPAVELLTSSFKGFGGILARVTGQTPPAGY